MKSLQLTLINLLSIAFVETCFCQIHGSIQVNVEGPVHFIITDSLGRRQGYDPRTSVTYDEIPNTYYEPTGIDSHDPNVPSVKSKEFGFEKSISNPAFADRYVLEVIGTEGGIFTVYMGLDRWPGVLGGSFELKGVIGLGQSVQYAFNFTMDSTKPLTATKIVVTNSLRQDLVTSYKLKLLGSNELFKELNKDLHKFEHELAQKDSLEARHRLEEFWKDIEEVRKHTVKEEEKGKENGRKKFITGDAYQILKEDVQLLLAQLPAKKKDDE